MLNVCIAVTTQTPQGRTAMKAARKLEKLQQPESLIEFVGQFLTARVWKQARQSVAERRAISRRDLPRDVAGQPETGLDREACSWSPARQP